MNVPVSLIQTCLYTELDPAFARRAKLVVQSLALKGTEHILEIGCGRGFYEWLLTTCYPNVTITAVDSNTTYLQKAEKTVSSSRVTFEKNDAMALTYKKESFDRVFATEVLEHVPDDAKMLKEMYRVLKKKGTAVITVPNKQYPVLWDPLNAFLERFFHTHVPKHIWWLAGIWADHERLYTEQELVEKAKKAGFTVQACYRATHACVPFTHFLFYGIGKNIVEMGLLKDFYRFETVKKPSFFLKLIRGFLYMADGRNKDSEKKDVSTVNLVLVLQKV